MLRRLHPLVSASKMLPLCSARALSSLTKEEIAKYLTTPPYTLPDQKKIIAPPMVYIQGEEMTRYTMELM
ncbi:hypothetical protein EON64_06365 [archaeon]|nr:MAG: hypothetical protein EON64_06365 [archaeon]